MTGSLAAGWEGGHIFYADDGIHTKHRGAESAKREGIEILLGTKNLLGAPYRLYYMSRNIEHVVGDNSDCSFKQKTVLAKEKRRFWTDDPKPAVRLLTTYDHDCAG